MLFFTNGTVAASLQHVGSAGGGRFTPNLRLTFDRQQFRPFKLIVGELDEVLNTQHCFFLLKLLNYFVDANSKF